MDPSLLPTLLGAAVLIPLVSFFVILLGGKKMGPNGQYAAWVAILAIGSAAVLSFWSLGIWLAHHFPGGGHHGDSHHAAVENPAATAVVRGQDPASGEVKHSEAPAQGHAPAAKTVSGHAETGHAEATHAEHGGHTEPAGHSAHAAAEAPAFYAGDFNVPGFGTPWVLGNFGSLRLSLSYYIDALTVSMFAMVTFIATLIHIYAMGYMHDELHDITDHEVTLANGAHLKRPGRFPRFFQYLSLFCFSMLGLVIAGNIAMVFVFWELVGACSYFLIGFYVERKSASTAANKAFITNRVGDFGMIIGLMALWTGLGTFSFADSVDGNAVTQPGIFSQVRTAANDHRLVTPDGFVLLSARNEVSELIRTLGPNAPADEVRRAIQAKIPDWRDGKNPSETHYGYWLLIVAGLGIFTGCVGKSAQFPLHVWLPDAMEGPTPVSALVHSATMVAAGVYLVGRFYPVFAPEVLLVIAVVGCITLFMAASIAITANDIKRVLAYSTVSQLGYMMMALGVGGWLPGMMHLITHAFFKSLLFMCSGSVIHAVHTNDMREMGGLLKKMPVTGLTMLVGCLAIAGAGLPFIIGWMGGPELAGVGFSGFYSKDAILEQAYSFMKGNTSAWAGGFFLAAAAGASVTAFYMFRMWYLTFVGRPRNAERYDHAHESPAVMYAPLIILSVMATAVAWSPLQGVVGGLIALIVLGGIRLYFGSNPLGIESAHGHGHDSHGHGNHGHDAQGSGGHDHGHGDGHGHDHDHGHAVEHGHGGAGWLPLGKVPLAASVLVLVVASLLAVAGKDLTLSSLLESARPIGTLPTTHGVLLSNWVWPNEHDSHAAATVVRVTLIAIGTAFAGFALATVMYALRKLNPEDVRKQFSLLYGFLVNKWWFDELYDATLIQPSHVIARFIAGIDRRWIDGFIDGLAVATRWLAVVWERVADRTIVDGLINAVARWTYVVGLSARVVQTGRLRQYVMFIAVAAVAIFVLISLWNSTLAG